jgi:hypothetical protein
MPDNNQHSERDDRTDIRSTASVNQRQIRNSRRRLSEVRASEERTCNSSPLRLAAMARLPGLYQLFVRAVW